MANSRPDYTKGAPGYAYAPRVTLADVRAAKPAMIFYSVNTCWWTHRSADLCSTGGPVSLPCDPRGGMLMQTPDVEDFLSGAESNPAFYGPHGLRAFEAALHGNVTIHGRPTCFRQWGEYSALLDHLDESAATGEVSNG